MPIAAPANSHQMVDSDMLLFLFGVLLFVGLIQYFAANASPFKPYDT